MRHAILPKRAFLLVLAIMIAGCARHYQDIQTLPVPNLQVLKERIEANKDALSDFKGFGVIVVRGPEMRQAFGIKTQYLAPSSFKIEFNGSMGVSMGTLILNERQYLLTGGGSGESFCGSIEDFNLADEFGIPIKGEDLLELFDPLRSIAEVPDTTALKTDFQTQQYSFITYSDSLTTTLWIAPYTPLITRELHAKASGDTVWFRNIEKVKKRSGVFFPAAWNGQIGSGEEAVTFDLEFSSLWLNKGISASLFDIDN